ncbi:glycoside hydrolase 100 family protein [Neptunitalea lumnitzerae]|uniref:beta-fructofuranosidase n=1 Tax=Neptunitalea lumnitzerae TaxID=2965509 RepID=A0ABQ5MGJ7_9FLAO|nr:glycoside hydrolase 100 family protein [Neptunitalea sp. Y10]GLB48513.1 hypothetical protein Y10_08810 [Neptunitalea sp. Y10]
MKYYREAIDLLKKASTPNGFLASVQNTGNYQRVWARDGVICGLAALASHDEDLIITFKNTLDTLAAHQHVIGTIPSNVLVTNTGSDVSYGGLAGRVDAVTWFIIGVCNYAILKDDTAFFLKHKKAIEKCFTLLDAWEFNNKHLVYVPLSGNWADEYVTNGYVLYDQLLRIWALKGYYYFENDKSTKQKIEAITEQVEANFFPNSRKDKFHEKAYDKVSIGEYLPCSFSPSGYKTFFDSFAHSLLIMLDIGDEALQNAVLAYADNLKKESALNLLPAFWPPIFDGDEHWGLLKDNCKYEFRNYPYEFHNGGSWPMVNGFYALALMKKNKPEKAMNILEHINAANALEGFSFYENFNSKTGAPNGVAYCAWSAAATILAHEALYDKFKFFI